jgi:hypothetical protein
VVLDVRSNVFPSKPVTVEVTCECCVKGRLQSRENSFGKFVLLLTSHDGATGSDLQDVGYAVNRKTTTQSHMRKEARAMSKILDAAVVLIRAPGCDKTLE